MKKWIALLVGAALLFALAGCSEKAPANAAPDTTAPDTAASGETQPGEPAATGDETENTAGESAPAQNGAGTAAAQTTAPAKDPAQTQTPKTEAPKATAAPTTQQNKTRRCTVAITCREILQHRDALDKNAARYLPDDGVLLAATQITVQNGQSVYDAVEAACRQAGVAINAERSIYGTYIKGFGGINEKCCGAGSGWLYFVNGESPSVSCSAYQVQNGDVIEFRFTCG